MGELSVPSAPFCCKPKTDLKKLLEKKFFKSVLNVGGEPKLLHELELAVTPPPM